MTCAKSERESRSYLNTQPKVMNTIDKIAIDLVTALNDGIKAFNEYLHPEKQLPLLSVESFFDLDDREWRGSNEINLGEVAYPGVYIILSTDEHNNLPYIYIGKASFSSSIGKRLHQHLFNSKQKDAKGFIWYQQPYSLHRVYTIDLSRYHFLASSLEEFLIQKIQGAFHLLNSTGNYQC